MATTTINTTAAMDARIVAAVGNARGLKAADGVTPRNATAAEVKAWLVEHMQTLVRGYERTQAESAVSVAPDIAPT